MNDTVKLIIEIPDKTYHKIIDGFYDYGDMNVIIQNGTPLDDVKAEIVKAYEDATMYSCDEELSRFASRVCGIIGDIGKAESEE